MTIARIGRGALVLGGVLVVVAAGVIATGGSVGLGGATASGGLVAAILVSLGAGLVLEGLVGSSHRPWARAGVALAGGGLLALSLGQISVVIDPNQPDQLGSLLWVALGLGGLAAVVVGLAVAAFSLMARP